jgi:hypothetical protein
MELCANWRECAPDFVGVAIYHEQTEMAADEGGGATF